MKTRISLLIAVAFFLVGSPAMANQFLPNTQGNSWTYAAGSSTKTSDVDSTSSGWRHYTEFAGFGPLWLWVSDSSDNVWYWDADDATYAHMLDTSDSVGSSFQTDIGACGPETLTIGAKNQTVNTPAGSFSGVLRIDLSNQCADAGTATIWLAPDVGVVKWEEITIAGSRMYKLQTATVDGETYPKATSSSAPYTISLSPDRASVILNRMPPVDPNRDYDTDVTTTFVIDNTGNQQIDLDFNSGQRFDIVVEDEFGNEVERWSSNRFFTQATGTVTIAPGDSASWEGTVELPESEGLYTVKMEIVSQNHHFAAETSVEVIPVY